MCPRHHPPVGPEEREEGRLEAADHHWRRERGLQPGSRGAEHGIARHHWLLLPWVTQLLPFSLCLAMRGLTVRPSLAAALHYLPTYQQPAAQVPDLTDVGAHRCSTQRHTWSTAHGRRAKEGAERVMRMLHGLAATRRGTSLNGASGWVWSRPLSPWAGRQSHGETGEWGMTTDRHPLAPSLPHSCC